MASSSSSSGRLPLQRALQNLRMECETGGQQRLQSQLNGKSIEELRKLCIAAGVSIRLGDSDVKLSKSDLVLELVRVLSTPAEAWWQMLWFAYVVKLQFFFRWIHGNTGTCICKEWIVNHIDGITASAMLRIHHNLQRVTLSSSSKFSRQKLLSRDGNGCSRNSRERTETNCASFVRNWVFPTDARTLQVCWRRQSWWSNCCRHCLHLWTRGCQFDDMT